MRSTGIAWLLGCLASVLASSPVSAQEGMWRWFATCARPNMMALEVRVEGRPVYQTSFWMCRENADGEFTRQGNPIIVFRFKAGREIVSAGYKQNDDKTDAAQESKGTTGKQVAQRFGSSSEPASGAAIGGP